MKYFINREKAFKLDINHLAEADEFISENLKEVKVSDIIANECRVIFEEIFSHIAEENKQFDKAAYLAVRRRFGQLEICFAFEGERVVYDLDKRGFDDLSLTILSRYRDRLNFLYRRGINEIRISVQESSINKSLIYVGAFALAIIMGGILCSAMDRGQCVHFVESYIAPVEELFGNGLLLLSSPLVCLSLIRNIITVFGYSDKTFKVRKTVGRILVMSGYSAAAGILAFALVRDGVSSLYGSTDSVESMDYSWLSDMITGIVPPNMLELMAAETTVPLVVFAAAFAAAICYSGKHFDMLRDIIEAIYVVFSKMLAMLMVLLPFAMFLALLNDALIYGVRTSIQNVTIIAGLGLIGVAILMILQLARFAIRGVNPVRIIKALKGAVTANLIINSTIDAVPYNTRYCVREIGIKIGKLESVLPVMAQINQSGNCYFLTFLPLCMLLWQNIAINVPVLIAVAVLSIILSIGAPGQPGTLIIGMLIVMPLLGLNTTDYMYVLIYNEVFFGGVMTFFNTFGDLGEITMEHMIEQRKLNRQKQ